MNRRGFFSKLAIGLAALPAVAKAACAARPAYGAGHEPGVVENIVQGRALELYRLNPAWVEAPYEVHFAVYPGTFERLVPERFVSPCRLEFGDPPRADANGNLVEKYEQP